MKNEKIIILGKSGSGKNFLLNGLKDKGYVYEPKITTRPIREGEINGMDYSFLSEKEYNAFFEKNEIKTHQGFKIKNQNWYYGITKENWNNSNLFIFTPHELSQLSFEERNGCFIVYIDISEDILRERLIKRNDNNDSVERRIASDNNDFCDFKEYDMKICDPEFEPDMVYDFAL